MKHLRHRSCWLVDATSDILQFKGRANTNFVPSTNNARQLGTASLRWKGAFSTANTSSSLAVGTSLGVGTTANIGGVLGVNNTITISNGASVAAPTVGLNYGNSSVSANLTANSTQTRLDVDYIDATNLNITGSAVLPDDTTLTATGLGAADLTVTNTAIFNASGAGDFVQFGNGNDRLTINFANAVANAHFLPDATTRDIGSDALKWGEGHFHSLLQVGGSGGIVLSDSGGSSTANVTADNIFARDDLVGASSSDQQLKDKVVKIDTALDKIEVLNGYEFVWNDNIGDFRSGTPDYGVIAQELEDVLPHAVDINNRGYKTVNYNSLIPLLIEAVKELSGRVKELEKGDEIDG